MNADCQLPIADCEEQTAYFICNVPAGYDRLIEGEVIGEPVPTKFLTETQLKELGLVGLYRRGPSR
jgi:hypothetical protein